MKTLLKLLAFLLVGTSAYALEIESSSISCIDDNSGYELAITKKADNKVFVKMYDLDLNRERAKPIYKGWTLTYNDKSSTYSNKSGSVEVQLYRSKNHQYGAALEVKKDGFFNDMFDCANL